LAVAEDLGNPDAAFRVGVLGATSLVGGVLLPLLCKSGAQVTAFSRGARPARIASSSRHAAVAWQQLTAGRGVEGAVDQPALPQELCPAAVLENWVCLAPVWVLPDCFDLLQAYGAQRVVALSSTSIFAKRDSADPQEQATAQRLAQAEQQVREWAHARGVQWVILRPTLIYGGGQDKNISEIARFIRRFGFFPVFGTALGQRQPIHAADVAAACVAALQRPAASNQAYNISGGETLPYCTMVTRVFNALSRRPRRLRVPLWAFRLAVALMRRLPRYRLWSAAMAERMGRDLVFDHADAARDLAFKPRSFLLTADDLPA
jgi:uncharacterized protein YbjT (DUF2867 family)